MELEGKVIESEFLRHLVEMGRDRFTGATRLEREDSIKILYFENGEIISASSNDPSESVDEILLRGKKVTREHIQQALVKRKPDATLGDALLTAGFISRKELRWARRHQIIEVLRSAITSEGSHYTVVPDYVSPRSVEGTSFSIAPILVELIVTDPDRKRIDQRLEGGKVRLRKSPSFDSRYGALGLNQEADRVMELVDGKRSATEIAAEAGGNGFMNLKLLAALRVLGLLEVNPKAQAQLEMSFGQAAAGESLLPGIQPHADIDVPGWELESVPEVEPGAGGSSREESPDSIVSEPEVEAESIPAVANEADLALDVGGADPFEEGGSEPEPFDSHPADAPESFGGEPAPVEELELPAAEDPIVLGEDDLESEVGRALDWSPPLPDEEEEPFSRTGDEGREGDEVGQGSSEEGSYSPEPELGAPDGPERSSGSGMWIVAGLVVIVLAVAGWMMFRGEDTDQQVQRSSSTGEGTGQGETVAESGEGRSPEETAPLESTAESPAEPQTGQVAVPAAPSTTRPQDSERIAADDPMRVEYDRRAREFAAGASEVPYTVQFEIVCQTSSVTLALREGGARVWFVPIAFQGRPCFRVFWGRYQSESAAQAAIGEIPARLRESRAVVLRPGEVTE